MCASRALLLLLVVPLCAQESLPATRPLPFADSPRLLAAAVTPARILNRAKDLCVLGPRPAGSDASKRAALWFRAALQESKAETKSDGPRFVLSCRLATSPGSPGAHESASGASALLECGRVLAASRDAGQLPKLPFVVAYTTDADDAEMARGLVVGEIRFGALGAGTVRNCLFVSVSADAAAVADLVSRIATVLAAWRAERGFWKDFEILADTSFPRGDGAPRLTLSCTAPAGATRLGVAPESRSAGDLFAAAGTAGDVFETTLAAEPQNAVHAARFALIWIAHLAAEGARK
jgi:hypothetical protein